MSCTIALDNKLYFCHTYLVRSTVTSMRVYYPYQTLVTIACHGYDIDTSDNCRSHIWRQQSHVGIRETTEY